MDQGWDEKITVQPNQVKCTMDWNSLSFKYHIGRSMLYVNFQCNRFKIRASGIWEQMDQSEAVYIVKIDYEMENWHHQLEVDLNWNLTLLRSEIQMTLGFVAPHDFALWILHENGQPPEKVQMLLKSFISCQSNCSYLCFFL